MGIKSGRMDGVAGHKSAQEGGAQRRYYNDETRKQANCRKQDPRTESKRLSKLKPLFFY